MILGSEKTDQLGSFTCLASIISEYGQCTEDAKSRIAKAHGLSLQLKFFWRIGR